MDTQLQKSSEAPASEKSFQVYTNYILHRDRAVSILERLGTSISIHDLSTAITVLADELGKAKQ